MISQVSPQICTCSSPYFWATAFKLTYSLMFTNSVGLAEISFQQLYPDKSYSRKHEGAGVAWEGLKKSFRVPTIIQWICSSFSFPFCNYVR